MSRFQDKTGESDAVNADMEEIQASVREKRRALSAENHRIAEQPGFVLHSHMF